MVQASATVESQPAQARRAAREAVEWQSAALAVLAGRLTADFDRVVDLLAAHSGAVVFTGLGKSGHVARQLAALFSSTGTRAVFLHASEAGHGDLGMCAPGDPVIFVSKSGATAELLRLAQSVRLNGSAAVGILGNVDSALAREMTIVLDASVAREADPNNVVPTASTVTALALGQALAIAVMTAKGFTLDDYARLHPEGAIGRNLTFEVSEVMHSGAEVAWVAPDDSLKQVVIAMTRRPLGAACVVQPDGSFAGLITDGDVRRAFERHDDIRLLTASDVLTPRPVSIGPKARVLDAVQLMENRPSQLSLLPVIEAGRCLGLIRLHDVFRPAARAQE